MFSTPSSPQFSSQRTADFNQAQQYGQRYSDNGVVNHPSNYNQGGYGSNFGHAGFNNGPRFSDHGHYNNNQREVEREVNQLRTLEEQLHSIRNSLQQDMMLGTNSQVSREISGFVLNSTEQCYGLIQQAIRHYQDCQNNYRFAPECQEYQQRERQFVQLSQIMDQIRQVTHHRMNSFDHNVSQQMAEEAMQLINQAQAIIHDVIRQVEARFSGQGNQGYQFGGNSHFHQNMIHGNNDWRNMNQYHQRSPFEQMGFNSFNQQYQNNNYQRGSVSPVMGQPPRFGMQPSHL